MILSCCTTYFFGYLFHSCIRSNSLIPWDYVPLIYWILIHFIHSFVQPSHVFIHSFIHSDFKNLSVSLLDLCNREDEKQTLKLITGQLEQFNHRTCIDMAVSMRHLEFVAHSSVQALLNDVWTGSIKNLDITTRDFLLTMIFPPYLITFDFRNETELKSMVQANTDQPIEAISLSLPLATPIKHDKSDDDDEENLGRSSS